MSIHSEISNKEVKSFIINLCDQRWETMRKPCKGCRYRRPIDDDIMCCMFPTVPRDWPIMEKEIPSK